MKLQAKPLQRIELTIPIRWAPGQIRHGRGYTFWPKTTRRYREALSASLAALHDGECIDEGPVRVELDFIRPRPKSAAKREWFTVRPDLDNLEKPTLDCMTGVFFADDAQVVEKTTRKAYGDSWSLRIVVEEIEQVTLRGLV